MPRVALSTFLKYCLLSERAKRTQYRKYLVQRDGYDFYWSLKKSVSAITFGGHSYDHCVGTIINPLKQKVERDHNTSALRAFVEWLGDRDRKFFQPPEKIVSTPKAHLSIRLSPEFGIVSDDVRRVTSLWNTKEPDLPPFYAGVGIYLMNEHLRVAGFENCQFTVLDLRKPYWYLSERLPDTIPRFVASEFDWVDNFFEEEKKKAA